MAKQYAREYEEHSSYGSAVRLVERAELPVGVILDLGCGRSPVAARLTEMGFTYVGGDIDLDALDDVRGRGFEAHELDLFVPSAELVARLESLLAGRPLAAVLALDVIEHLVDPVAVLGALHDIVSAHPGAELVVSIPNVTHVDIGTKLLAGRWDMTDTGLLDDTHLQFFSGPRLDGMLAGTGWAEVDADDVELPISDQCFPVDLPGLRRGAPLHDVFAWARRSAGPGGETYQFVRRLRPVEPIAVLVPKAGDIARVVDEDRPLATVVVVVAAGDRGRLGAILADLAGQTEQSFEVVVVAASGTVDHAELEQIHHRLWRDRGSPGPEIARREVPPSLEVLVAVLQEARGRYVCVLGGGARVSGDWLAGLREMVAIGPSRLVQMPMSTASPVDLGFWEAKSFEEAGTGAESCDPTNWDLFHDAPMGSCALAALALPAEAVQAAGLTPDPADGDLAWPAFALRVALMAGTVTSPTGSVLVAEDDLIDLDPRADELLDRLDGIPLVGRTGTVGRFGLIRSRLDHHRRAETELRSALTYKDHELTALIHHTAELGREVDRLNADVARLNASLTRRLLGPLVTRVRQQLRG